jgi:tRNA modification GTPase
LQAIENAELILAVFDVSSRFTAQDEAILKMLEKKDCEKIAVLNKSDMDAQTYITTEISKRISDSFENIITISAKNGDNVPLLCERIEKLFVENKIDYDNCAILTRARQKNAVDSASQAVRCAISALKNGFTLDVAGMDIEEAMSKLLQVDSREVSADIVDSIFLAKSLKLRDRYSSSYHLQRFEFTLNRRTILL